MNKLKSNSIGLKPKYESNWMIKLIEDSRQLTKDWILSSFKESK